MAWSRYGRRYRRYRKYRRFYRRYRRGYGRKYVNGSSRSSVRMKTTVNTTYSLNAGYGADATSAAVSSVSTLSGTNNSPSAANSPLFRTYCSLYEEMKVIGLKVNIAIVDAVGSTTIPSVQIFTAWDRKYGFGEAQPSVADVKASSTSNVATALNNNVAKLTRSCYASDLMEKATWFDSTLDTAANNYTNLAYQAAALNPNMFSPAFFFFLNCPTLGAVTSIKISLSVTYYFAFRNPRYGGSGGSAKLVDMGSRSVDYPDEEGGDMDDGPSLRSVDDRVIDDVMALPDASDSTARRAASVQEKRNAQRNASRNAARRAAPIVVDPKN